MKWLGEFYVDGLYYLNYGMVDLFIGKMKLWEGIVVDVDDLMVEVIVEVEVVFKDSLEISFFIEE